jgi:integrase
VDAVAWKRPKVSKSVDRRVVVNPGQARELLTTVTYVGGYRRARGRRLWAFFACLYYAGLRPGEALGLRASDCHLPEKGWGSLVVWETRPTAGRRWTDTGQSHDRRGLKNRPQDDIRHVPIPPVLIRSLRAHLNEFGTSVDGRLFTNERGGIPGASTYSRVWTEARLLALTPDQVASPMAARPYDLRHAALSTWLNSGVDPTEVAERAGNSS